MKIHKIEETIRFSDTDAAGICYFARYAGLFDESYISLMRKEGINFEEYKNNWLQPIVETKTIFFHPLHAGDIVSIYTAILEVKEKFLKAIHLITLKKNNIDKKVATGFIARVTVNVKSFKSISLPEDFKRVVNQYKIERKEWDEFVSDFK